MDIINLVIINYYKIVFAILLVFILILLIINL